MPPALAGRDAAVVVGGDGAMRLAAEPAADAGVPLYHCPAGTENLVARYLGATNQAAGVVAAIERLEVRRLDLGLAAFGLAPPAPFLLMASAGFDAHVIHTLAAGRRGAITHLSYLGPIAKAIVGWRPARATVTVDDGEAHDLGSGVAVVANLPAYAFRIDPGRGALPDDGLLDLAFLPCHGGIGAAWWAVTHKLRAGTVPGVVRLRGERIALRFDRPVAWQVDGDAAADAAGPSDLAVLTLRPRAVPVVLPVTVASAARSAAAD
jgi:diacylglycerol kinase (ATP)